MSARLDDRMSNVLSPIAGPAVPCSMGRSADASASETSLGQGMPLSCDAMGVLNDPSAFNAAVEAAQADTSRLP